MIATWRLIAAGVLGMLSYFITKPVMEALLAAIRRRIGKGFQWITDVQRYMLVYLSWICFALLLITIAKYILELENDSIVVDTLQYFLAIPVVLGTFALRKVMTNMLVRHFAWDRDRTENATRIFVVTECINASRFTIDRSICIHIQLTPCCTDFSLQFVVFAIMTVEVFYIFFVSNEMAQFLLVLVFACLETLVILAGFTTLKNVATGLFLIFAEPFRTGVECHVRNLRGRIERVSLARTTLRRRDNALVFIPNSVFADSHQTTRNAASANDATDLHVLELRVANGTPIALIQQLIDDLLIVLPQFAAVDRTSAAAAAMATTHDDALPVDGRATSSRVVSFRDSESLATPQQQPTTQQQRMTNESFASTIVDGNATTTTKSVRVVLSAMFCIKIRIVVDCVQFPTFERVKTEINLAIVESLQRIGVRAMQQRIVRRY